jgi:hypothetical protein
MNECLLTFFGIVGKAAIAEWILGDVLGVVLVDVWICCCIHSVDKSDLR